MGVDMSYPSFLRRAVQSESSGFFDIPHHFYCDRAEDCDSLLDYHCTFW